MPAVLDLDTEDTGLIEISQRRSSRIRRQVGKTIEIVDKNSTNPLHDAFRNLVPEDLLDALFDSVTNVSLNRLPAEDRYTWVNGLRGVLTVPKKGKHKKKGYFEVGTGENRQRFGIDEEVSWEVRWDTDDKNENPADDKGPHVNADFSVKKKNGARVKFDIRLNPTRFSRRVSSPNGDATPSSDGGDPNEPYAETIRREGKEFMKKLRDGINFAIGYNGEFAGNRRLSAAEEAAREDIMKQLRDNLVNRWRPIVNGPCDESNPLY